MPVVVNYHYKVARSEVPLRVTYTCKHCGHKNVDHFT